MSRYTIEVVKRVDLEVAEQRAFLETRRIGLGDHLLDDILRVTRLISIG